MIPSKPIPAFAEDDARCQPRAYISSGPSLYRVVRITRESGGWCVWIEDCLGYQSLDPEDINRRHKSDNGYCFHEEWRRPAEIKKAFKLVRAAPAPVAAEPVLAAA